MLAHASAEIRRLAGCCVVMQQDDIQDWSIDLWKMDDVDVAAAVDVYTALLAGGVSDPVVDLLLAAGIPVADLLYDSAGDRDDITRVDLTELIAAASLMATEGCDTDLMHMPNVPKMARKKSDSCEAPVVPRRTTAARQDVLAIAPRARRGPGWRSARQ